MTNLLDEARDHRRNLEPQAGRKTEPRKRSYRDADEPFVRIPSRVLAQLHGKPELLALATFLIGRGERNEWTVQTTTAELLGVVGWQPTRADTLKRRLTELEGHGLVRVSIGQGRRSPFTVKLTGLAIIPKNADLRTAEVETGATPDE